MPFLPFFESLDLSSFFISIMELQKGKEINTDQESTIFSQKSLSVVSFRMLSAACNGNPAQVGLFGKEIQGQLNLVLQLHSSIIP